MEKEKYYRAIGNKILSVERTETGKYKVNHVYTVPFGRTLPKQGEVSKDYVDWLLSNKRAEKSVLYFFGQFQLT